MGARLVLLAFGLLYALVGVAMSPAHGRIAPLDEWVWDGLTLGSFAVLLGLERPAQWLADTLGMSAQTAVIGIIAAICLALAVFAIWRLTRKGGKALATFLLMLAVTVPAGVVLTLYEFSTLGH